jgi:predicted O-linked N-acetylglucosamine transferase (SPINDLY family)
VAAYRRALELKPDFAQAHNNLGVALLETGRPDEALASFHRALALEPGTADFHNNLGNALTAQGQFEPAIAAYCRAVELKPAYAEAHSNLGNALREQGRFVDAIAAFRRALEFAPGIAGIHNNLANAFCDAGQLDAAITAYRQALALQPGLIEARSNLGNVLAERGALDEALATLRQAIELQPAYAEAHNNLGNVLKDQGCLDEAIAAYRHALDLNPLNAKYQSNIILTLLCHPSREDGSMAEAQQRWNELFCVPFMRAAAPFSHDRSPEHCPSGPDLLRIGYVSSAFAGSHVVGRNLRPLFLHHEHQHFEIICYSDTPKPDEMTEEFRQGADQWRETVGLTDEALAAKIREDRVDILVDLNLHTSGNRLPVFARRPAPVQVSFAGYPESAGIEAIEFRISDRWLESEMQDAGHTMQDGIAARSHPETCNLQPASGVYLLDSFWCYDPCGIDVAINEPPQKENGCITFGSLNNFCKITEPMLKLWARLLCQSDSDLAESAGSRLLLLAHPGSHRQRIIDLLTREGVEPHRIEFADWRPRREYLELYHRLDIVLDPFPYGGHTTTLDALWMGVPVVSLAGNPPVSRAGLSILNNLGLPELVAFSEDDYIRIATDLARDSARLAELRRTLRPRMATSVLMDAPSFARNIESAYRAMWRQWCAKG